MYASLHKGIRFVGFVNECLPAITQWQPLSNFHFKLVYYIAIMYY